MIAGFLNHQQYFLLSILDHQSFWGIAKGKQSGWYQQHRKFPLKATFWQSLDPTNKGEHNLLKWNSLGTLPETNSSPMKIPSFLGFIPSAWWIFHGELRSDHQIAPFPNQSMERLDSDPISKHCRCHWTLRSMVGMLVPLKGGIGGIVHPPIGRKNTTYIPLIVLAFWGVICYLPPFTGTWKIHWSGTGIDSRGRSI